MSICVAERNAHAPPNPATTTWLPQRLDERIMRTVAPATITRYRAAYAPWARWCYDNDQCPAPATERAMIRYLDQWRRLPIHTHGCRCRDHRPTPATALTWLSAVRFWHRIGDPPIPWEGGARLTNAMLAYTAEAYAGGWAPRTPDRAWPDDVRAMVDALDLAEPRGLRNRAIILTGFYAATGAGALARLRIRDVNLTNHGVHLSLRTPAVHRSGFEVRPETRQQRYIPANDNRAYCAAAALDDYLTHLRNQNITRGALLRPLDRWGNIARGGETDAPDYRISSIALTNAVHCAATAAGLENAADLTCYSLRRGRAEWESEGGCDPIDLAEAYGWSDGRHLAALLRRLNRPTAVPVGAALL